MSSISPTSGVSPYLAELYTLNQYDNEELMQVSLGTPSAGLSNVDSVLAQASTIDAELAAQSASTATATGSSSSTASDPLNIPSYNSIINDSDQAAATTLQSYANAGTGSVLDYQTWPGSTASSGAGSTSGSSSSGASSTSTNPLAIPSYSSIINDSDQAAATTLQNYANAGTGSILDYQA